MSRRKGETVSGDAAWEKCGMRMTSEDVAEMNRLREASRTRALTSQEETRLYILSQRNKLRTRVL